MSQVIASRYLGTAAMFSAQTRARSPRDTLDRVERAATRSDHGRSQIEGRLKFDFLTAVNVQKYHLPHALFVLADINRPSTRFMSTNLDLKSIIMPFHLL